MILDSLFSRLNSDLRLASAASDLTARQAALDKATEDFRNLYGMTPAQHAERARRAKVVKGQDAQRAVIEKIFTAALERILDKAEAQVLATVRARLENKTPTPVAADLIFSLKEFEASFMAEMAGASEAAYLLGEDFSRAHLMETAHGNVKILLETGVLKPSQITRGGIVSKYVNERANLIKGVPESIYSKISETLKEGAVKGETTDELAARVRQEFNTTRTRADLIARTETASAYQASSAESMKSAGYTHKQWVTYHDDKVRPSHIAFEEKGVIPMDDEFAPGLKFPCDPEGEAGEVINCRCYLKPEVAPE